MTRHRSIVATCMLLAAPLCCQADPATPRPGVISADLPEEVERKIDEQTEHLPDEVREKIREKLKERIADKMAEQSAAADDSSESSDGDDSSDESADGEKDKPAAKDDAPKRPTASPQSEESKKLRAEMELYDTKFKHKIFEYKKDLEAQLLILEKNKLDRKIESERIAAAKEAMSRERDRMKLDIEIGKLKLELEKQRLAAEMIKLEAEKKRIETAMEVESTKEKLEDRVLGDEQYPDEPFQDGVLTISPRRIELNGPIMTGAADYVCQRLDYFNNQSSKPIFLVIDNCPGGSVMEGFQIVQRIEQSRAPVHVVVKRFAASMAACITTLADHSYCYPNAIILHHQASTSFGGNGRSLEDQKRQFDEISDRLLGSVAEKIGTDYKSFVDEMYKNRISGDWDVFGDKAVELKWVGNIVEEVREESIRRRPTGMRNAALRMIRMAESGEATPAAANYLERYEAQLVEEIDAQGNPFVRLPRISPIDAWLIYDPAGYYR